MADQKHSAGAWPTPEAFDLWRNDFESAPPAYNSVMGTSQPGPSLAHEYISCCAFDKLNAITHPSNHNVFQRTPQLRLIGWVVLCRATDDSLTREQRFSCPLASCDAHFSEDEHMQLVNHVSACRHLAEGEYLCPYHGVVENFMTPTGRSDPHRSSKRQFLRRTIGKICRLGSKSARTTSESIAGPSEPSVSDRDAERRRNSSSNKRPRLDQISAPIVSHPIIHAPFFSSPPPPPSPPSPPPVELDAIEIQELEGWTGPTMAAPPCWDHYQELPGVEPLPQEMDTTVPLAGTWDISDNRFSNSSMASASDSVFTENTLSPVSPISRDSFFSMDGFDCPVSKNDASPYKRQSLNASLQSKPRTTEGPSQMDDFTTLTLAAPLPTIPPPVGRRSPRPIPSIRVDTSFNKGKAVEQPSPFATSVSSFDSPTSENSENRDSGLFSRRGGLFDGADTKNSRHLVAELRGLFNTLFKVSLQKLSADPGNAAGKCLLNWNTSPAVLFERGMRALQRVVNGELPNDITGIFGLSLLTYACGLADVDFSMPEHFASIFEEQLRWSSAIQNQGERELYTNLIHQLWAPDTRNIRSSFAPESAHQLLSSIGWGYSSGPIVGWEKWDQADLSLGYNGMSMPFAGVPGDVWSRPPSAYLNGAAIGLCQRFLDNFEYLLVDLRELSSDVPEMPDFGLEIPSEIADPSTINHEILMANVIRPLANNPALQSFMSVVEKASLLLETFPNMPLRNTELSLMQEGKEHHASQLLRQAFTSEVQRLANEASDALGCGASFRAYYYNRDIDKILKLHGELLALESTTRVERSRSSSLSSAKGKTTITYSPASTYASEGSLPSSPRRPWSMQAARGSASDSPRISSMFHSRHNSDEEMGALGPDPIGTIDPSIIESSINRNSAPSAVHANMVSLRQAAPAPTTRETLRGQHPSKNKSLSIEGAPMFSNPRPASTPASHPMSAPVSTMPTPTQPRVAPLATFPSATSTPIPTATPSMPPAASPPAAGPDGKATQSCNICGQRFEGKAQYIKANVTRHVREKHRGNAKRLECGEPRCKYASTRRGNLLHHRRTVHGIE